MPTLITVPPGLSFDALQINLASDGIQFDFTVIEAICLANHLDPAVVAADSDKLVALIAAWYTRDRDNGGPRRPVVECLVCGTGSAVDQFVVA